jgi:acyl-homoserine-lactone acylase
MKTGRGRIRSGGLALVISALVVALPACNGGGRSLTSGGSSGKAYQAEIRRTTYGIPHVKADNYAGIGYGFGYAFAEDNLCLLLDDLVTIRGERSRYFGPDGTYFIPANDALANNVDSDFFWKSVATDEAIKPLKKAALPEAADATRGFKDGFNRYIRELKAGQHPGRHAACASGEWLKEITLDDMYRRYFRLGVLASSSVFVTEVATAQPPALSAPSSTSANSTSSPTAEQMVAALRRDPGPLRAFDPDVRFGSNMYSVAPGFSETGNPIQFVNPHFPWISTERLYLAHATIPGELDIMGVGLYGVPAALIGFNDHIAWSHTVSTAYRFTFYELTLVPGDPTSYIYNGQTMKMTAVPVTIKVLQPDGSLKEMSRTLYRSKYGPMLHLAVSGVDILPWTPLKAYTLRDANAENDRLINQFFRWNQAQSYDEFLALHKSVLGVPWVNTTATGPGGKAYYGDVTVVPNVPDSKAQACSTSVQAQVIAQLLPGLPLLDGSRTDCEWDTDDDAPAPGIFGPSHLPTLERDDWVGNNNDSYWLTNPAQPIEGYAKIIGQERSVRSLRTRNSIIKMLKRADGSDGQPGNKWTQAMLEEAVLNSNIYSADLARDDVVNNICPFGTVLTTSGPVDVSQGCTVLANWDKTNNRDSVGGHVWREFWRGAAASLGGVLPNPLLWTTPFSADDPVNTPSGLNILLPTVQAALGDAVKKFNDLGIPLDAKLGDIQHSGVHGDPPIPLFGGEGNMEGAFTIARGPLDESGYHVDFGNSFVSVITWDAGGVKADGFITYSQSTDPANPHFRDWTEAYSQKQWTHLPFHEAEITAAQQGETLTISE